jgi:hypothetical protein
VQRLRVNPALVQLLHQLAGVGRGGYEHGGPIVLQHRQLVIDVERVFRDDRSLDALGAQDITREAARGAVAEIDLEDVIGRHARGHELARDEPAPMLEIVLSVASDELFALRADRGMQANHFAERERKHPVGEAPDQIGGMSDRQASQIFQRFHTDVADDFAIAADVAFQSHEQGLQAFELQLLQLIDWHAFEFGIEELHCQISW